MASTATKSEFLTPPMPSYRCAARSRAKPRARYRRPRPPRARADGPPSRTVQVVARGLSHGRSRASAPAIAPFSTRARAPRMHKTHPRPRRPARLPEPSRDSHAVAGQEAGPQVAARLGGRASRALCFASALRANCARVARRSAVPRGALTHRPAPSRPSQMHAGLTLEGIDKKQWESVQRKDGSSLLQCRTSPTHRPLSPPAPSPPTDSPPLVTPFATPTAPTGIYYWKRSD